MRRQQALSPAEKRAMPIDQQSFPEPRDGSIPGGSARCPACAALGYPGDRYCACCGGAMARACAVCGVPVAQPVANFCANCGSPLVAVPATLKAAGENRTAETYRNRGEC